MTRHQVGISKSRKLLRKRNSVETLMPEKVPDRLEKIIKLIYILSKNGHSKTKQFNDLTEVFRSKIETENVSKKQLVSTHAFLVLPTSNNIKGINVPYAREKIELMLSPSF